jgi:galactonate dehydratase
MRDTVIVAVTTVQTPRQPNVLWVLIETNGGLTGLGETFFWPDTVAAYVHEVAAPYLLGKDALDIGPHHLALYRLWSRKGVGAEARGASAVDIALWDVLGKATGLPLYRLLGGASRDRIGVYNTCAGPDYQSTPLLPGDSLFGPMDPDRPMEDLWAQEHAPAELAQSLLDMGISAMKIWPFDATLAMDGGQMAPAEVVARGRRPFEAIREAVGDRMEIALEMRSRWLLPAARRIASEVEEFRPLWIEDPIRSDSLDALASFRRSTRIPVAAGENLGSRFRHREMIDAGAVDIVLTDVSWNGGITEARRVADMAATAMLPFGLHDCTGPVGLAASVHLSMHAEAAFMQEFARAYYYGWYREVSEGLPPVEDGWIRAQETPGHGLSLHPEFLVSPLARTRQTASS